MRKRITRTLGLTLLFVLTSLPGWAQGQYKQGKVYKEAAKTPLTPPDLNIARTVDRTKHPYILLRAPRKQSFINTPLFRPSVVKQKKASPLTAGYSPTAWVFTSAGWTGVDVSSLPLTGSDPQLTTLASKFCDNQPNGGAAIYDDIYHSLNYFYYSDWNYVSGFYDAYSTTDWSKVSSSLFHDLTLTAACTAYNPSDKKVYGFFNNSDATALEFGTVDYDAMTRTTISSEDTLLVAIAANKNGQLFGITSTGNLVQINKTTGALTVKGSTGYTPMQYTQSAAFDMKTGKLYWAAYVEDTVNNKNSIMCEVDTKTGKATKLFDVPDNQEILYMYIPAPPAEDGAPDQVSDLALNFIAPSKTGHVTFTVPALTFSQETLTGDVTYYIIADGMVKKQGTAQPGQKVDEEITVAGGDTKVTVYTENTIGKSIETSLEKWIGYDVPDLIPLVVMTADSATNTAYLHWTPSKRGLHDEYLVPSELKYDVVRMPDSVVVANEISDTTFSEVIPVRGIKAYYYTVTPINGDQKGQPTASNHKTLGDAFEIPYVEDFLDQDAFNMWTVLNNNNDVDSYGTPTTWKWDDLYSPGWGRNNHGQAVMNGNNWGDGDDDDWLVSPNIRLENGFDYNFGFQVRDYTNGGQGKMEVYVGQGSDPTKYTQQVFKSDSLMCDNFTWQRSQFSVPADGKYHIAIHATHATFYMDIDSVFVDMKQGAAAPDSVTNLKVTPEETGELLGTVSFNAPTKGLDGSTLSQISKIVVIRKSNGRTIHTFKNPQPGASLSYTDSAAVNGMNTYRVVPYNRDGLGKGVEVTQFIGEDKPDYVKNITAYDQFDGTAKLAWENPGAVGANGHFVNKDKLTYNLYSAAGDTLLWHSTAMDYTVSGLPQSGEQQLVQYGVSASSKTGEGGISATPVLLTGAPYSLPFHESFAGGQSHYSMWWFDYGNQNNGWYLNGDYTADNDGGAVYWYANSENTYCTMSTGKIDVSSAKKPVLEFSYYYNGVADFKLNVYCQNSSRERTLVKTIDFSKLSGQKYGWRTCFVDLTPELSKVSASKPYFILSFEEHAETTTRVMFLLDNINVRDEVDNNLSVRIEGPSRLHVSDKATVTAYVKNVGSKSANGFTVRLLANGRQVSSQKCSLDSHAEKQLTFTYQPLTIDGKNTPVEVSVDYPSDADVTDNSAIMNVDVYANEYPAVDSLCGEQVGENVNLKWAAPKNSYSTTEDFEFYDPLTICTTGNLGPWKTVDGDSLSTYGFNIGYKGEFDPQSFVVFNPENLGISLDLNPGMAPYSGNQSLLCMSAYKKNDDYGGDNPWYAPKTFDNSVNDDWLISQELSGKAQTVTYHFGNISDDAMNHVEVMYSTTTASTSDFQSIRVDSVKEQGWHEFSFALPEGAKYFALHVTPVDKSSVLIDDITYQPKDLTIDGYYIYRDGELFDSVRADKTSYTDVLPDNGDHSYQVSVVYATGESGLSNKVQIIVTLINARTVGGKLQAMGGNRQISITNAEGKSVSIFGIDGSLVYKGAGKQMLTVPVQSGQYLVRIDGKTFNLIVR